MEFEPEDKTVPIWKFASKRVQDGYVAIPHDCTIVAVRLLLVFKNIKETSCFMIDFLDKMVQYLDNELKVKNEKLKITFDGSKISDEELHDTSFEKIIVDQIKELYKRQTSGFIYFHNADPYIPGHVVSFLYNFGEDTLDFFEKDPESNLIIYTSIGADNQNQSIFNLFFNVYSDESDLVVSKIFETVPLGVGGSKKCRKCGLRKY
jgi:hypothetical protein